jgi:hypothetical protein
MRIVRPRFREDDVSLLFPENLGPKETVSPRENLGQKKTGPAAATLQQDSRQEVMHAAANSGVVLGGTLGWLIGIGTIAVPELSRAITLGFTGSFKAALAGILAGSILGRISGYVLGFLVSQWKMPPKEARARVFAWASGVWGTASRRSAAWRPASALLRKYFVNLAEFHSMAHPAAYEGATRQND